MIDLTKIEKPFGMLSAKKKKALREYKGTIEVFDGSRWVSADCPSFFPTCAYRATNTRAEKAELAARWEGDLAEQAMQEREELESEVAVLRKALQLYAGGDTDGMGINWEPIDDRGAVARAALKQENKT